MALTLLVTLFSSPWLWLIITRKLFISEIFFPSIKQFLINFFNNFTFDYLFFNGDPIVKNQIPEIGVFCLWQLPFIIIGSYHFFLSKSQKRWWLIFLIIIFATLSSFVKSSPNLPFSIPLLLIYSIIISYGIKISLKFIFNRLSLIKIIVLLAYLTFIIYNWLFSWHQFSIHYPKRVIKIYG